MRPVGEAFTRGGVQSAARWPARGNILGTEQIPHRSCHPRSPLGKFVRARRTIVNCTSALKRLLGSGQKVRCLFVLRVLVHAPRAPPPTHPRAPAQTATHADAPHPTRRTRSMACRSTVHVTDHTHASATSRRRRHQAQAPPWGGDSSSVTDSMMGRKRGLFLGG